MNEAGQKIWAVREQQCYSSARFSMAGCEAILYTAVTKGLDCLWLLAASVVCMLMAG